MERQNASSPFSFSNFNPITPSSPMKFGFSSTDSGSSSPVAGDRVPGLLPTVPSWLLGTSFVSTDNSTLPWFSKASSSTVISSSLGPTTTNNCFSDSLSSVTSPSSVSEITTTVSATSTSSLSGKTSVSTSSPPQSTVSAPGFVTVPASCSPEQDEVAAILARQCEKLLSRQAQGRGQNEKHVSVAQPCAYGAMEFETKSSSKPVGDAAHIPAATTEQKYGESKPCSVPISGAPSISTPSFPMDSKSGSSLLPSSQPVEEEQPYLPPVDLLDSTIGMWERVVVNNKTDQEVTEEGLRHFYEGINYFCLLSERLLVVTDKYDEEAKVRDEMEKMTSSLKDKLAKASRKLEDSKKEKESLEHELAGAANKITALTGEKDSILLVQTFLHQTISELRRELEEAGPAAIQRYKASSLYRQELMEYAAPYMGNGVKLAIEKIKAKDPTFEPETYGLEMYILPPEADDQEFSSEESDGGC
ncbi:serine-rich adhesin for platelets-like [Solanum tuberosum]|uniref:Proteophosphoglycan ppg4 n=1 Tax=Solanum tuberosum TaxID=4113 RepID=M1AA08_SOLTU|nr:PREDICTED: serine-rich adhesin for platelets-like [Solanum tuberosum]